MPTAPSMDAHAEQRRIDAELVDIFHRNIPAAVLSLNAILALLLVGLLHGHVERGLLLGWAVLVTLIALFNGWTNLRYRAARQRPDYDVRRWQAEFLAGALFNGTAWGLGGALLYTPATPIPSMFLLLVICGVAAGSVASQSSLPRALFGFLIPATLIPAARSLLILDSAHLALALLLVLYIGFLAFVTRTNYRTLLESVRLRLHNQSLLEALTKSERHFRALFENALDWVSVVRDDGTFSFQSASVQQLLGWHPEELAGRDILSRIHQEDREPVQQCFSRIFAEGGTAAVEARWRHREGRWVLFQGLVRRFEGDERALVMTARDVTERHAFEQHLRRAKEAAETASRVKDQFLASMSHEIRTPLHAMQGLADLLSETPLTLRQQEYVAGFQEAVGHLTRLVNDLLDFSRMNAGGLTLAHEPFDLFVLLDGVSALLWPHAMAKGLQLSFEVVPGVSPHRKGDVGRLRQVLVNLVGNGVKFTDRGEVRVTVAEREGWLHFSVADTGRGIPGDKQAMLFQPFFQVDASSTREFGGAGLGLAISRGLVEAMGGRIDVRSTPGAGSEFRFAVPLPVTAPVGEEGPAAARDELPPARILVADDAELNLMVIREFFRDTPCRLDFVRNGREAVAAWEQGRYELILMDIQMPEMDGWEATRAIRAQERRTGRGPVPIVALTAGALDEERSKALAVGCSDFLPKPVSKDRLLARVAQHLQPQGKRSARGDHP